MVNYTRRLHSVSTPGGQRFTRFISTFSFIISFKINLVWSRSFDPQLITYISMSKSLSISTNNHHFCRKDICIERGCHFSEFKREIILSRYKINVSFKDYLI